MKKMTGVLIAAACGVIAVLIIVIVVLMGRLNSAANTVVPVADTPVTPRGVLVTEDNVEEVLEEMETVRVQPGYFRVNQNLQWRFPDGASESTNAYVKNNDSNSNDVYFDLIREDNRDVIYQSPVIPLGATLDHFALDVDLDAGSYDCIVQYHLIDSEQNTLSLLNFGVTVIVAE